MSSDFFMTLVSNSSMNIFPENKTSSFTVQLPEKITLNNSWCVAVAEIHYNYNFFNVTRGNNQIILTHKPSINDTDIAKNVTNNIGKLQPAKTSKIEIESGFYNSVSDIMDMINHELRQKEFADGEVIDINKKNGRTNVYMQNVRGSIEKICFKGRLALQMGFKPDQNIMKFKVSPYVGNIFFGIPEQMMIYTDIIEPTYIGHEKAYVLKIVNTEANGVKFGDVCYKEYTHMHYMPIQKREFESISVDIRDYTGHFMPFEHGILTIKLHFKKNGTQQRH